LRQSSALFCSLQIAICRLYIKICGFAICKLAHLRNSQTLKKVCLPTSALLTEQDSRILSSQLNVKKAWSSIPENCKLCHEMFIRIKSLTYTHKILYSPYKNQFFYKNSKILCHNESAAFVTFKMGSMEWTTLLC
jgi:hypothetical protein